MHHTRNRNDHFHYGTIDVFLLVENKHRFLCGDAKTICHISEYTTVVKQLFGPTYIYAPLNNNLSLKIRYKDNYYITGDVNDNCHYKNKEIGRFILNNNDRSFRSDFVKTIISTPPTLPTQKKKSCPPKLHRKLIIRKIDMRKIKL